MEQQRGHQEFPFLYDGHLTMTVNGRHIDPAAQIVVNGRRVLGEVGIDGESVSIELKELPPVGIHLLQLQNSEWSV